VMHIASNSFPVNRVCGDYRHGPIETRKTHFRRFPCISCVSFNPAASFLLHSLRMERRHAMLKPMTWGDAFEEATRLTPAPMTPAEFCAALFDTLRDVHADAKALSWDDVFDRATALTNTERYVS
jgi:hypothetical protein